MEDARGSVTFRSTSTARQHLEELLAPWLSRECAGRLWSETWDLAGVTTSSLWAWAELFGADVAALAVAARLTETDLRRHLDDGLRPDRAALEMLADLNCFPFVTPAARPMAVA